NPDARPGTVQTAILPEAGFVLEDDDTAATSGLLADRRQALGEPQLLRCLVGARQAFARSLYREAELMQESRDVVVVVPDREPATDQAADPRPGPDAPGVARSRRPLLDERGELVVLRRGEPRRGAGCLARLEPLGPRRVVPPKPLVHRCPHD